MLPDRGAEPWRTILSASQRGDIPNLARTVLYEFGVPRAPINVDIIAERLGVCVQSAPSSASWYGAAQTDKDGATIWLREDLKTQEPWRRFTLAHELGHVLLHDTTTAVRDIGFSKGGIEGEATRFATALLVPAMIFEEMLGFSSKKIEPSSVGEIFGVPEEVVRLQLAEFFGYPVDW